jgi:hypothetical protein
MRAGQYLTWSKETGREVAWKHSKALWLLLLLGGSNAWATAQPLIETMLREAMALEPGDARRLAALPRWLLGKSTAEDIADAVQAFGDHDAPVSKRPVFREDKLGAQFKAWQQGKVTRETLVASFHNWFGSADCNDAEARALAARVFSHLVEPCTAREAIEMMRREISKHWKVFTPERLAVRASQPTRPEFVGEIPVLRALLDDFEARATNGAATIQYDPEFVTFTAPGGA